MRVFFGMIIGALLTVAAAYFHDSMGKPAEARTAASEQQMIVNWNVAQARWQDFKSGWTAVKSRAREGWVTISAHLPK